MKEDCERRTSRGGSSGWKAHPEELKGGVGRFLSGVREGGEGSIAVFAPGKAKESSVSA
jgi:hypothetical protein